MASSLTCALLTAMRRCIAWCKSWACEKVQGHGMLAHVIVISFPGCEGGIWRAGSGVVCDRRTLGRAGVIADACSLATGLLSCTGLVCATKSPVATLHATTLPIAAIITFLQDAGASRSTVEYAKPRTQYATPGHRPRRPPRWPPTSLGRAVNAGASCGFNANTIISLTRPLSELHTCRATLEQRDPMRKKQRRGSSWRGTPIKHLA